MRRRESIGGRIHRVDHNLVARWSVKEKDALLDRFKIMQRQEGGGAMKGREFDALNHELLQLVEKGGGHFRHKGEILAQTPLQVARKVDRVVDAGMNQMAKLGTGKSGTSFRYQQAGDGTGAESAGDTALGNRLVTSDLDVTGSRFDSGNDMKFAGFFDESSPSATYSEFGNSTASTAGTLLNRTLLDVGDRITFTNGTDIMTFTSVILGTGS